MPTDKPAPAFGCDGITRCRKCPSTRMEIERAANFAVAERKQAEGHEGGD